MEQFDRTKRYLNRIIHIYDGISSSYHDKEAYDDDVISFFIHCYHVKDWILHLSKIKIKSKDIDTYINQHLALRICADMANGSKHCKLTRTMRTCKQPHIVGKQRETSTWLTNDGGTEVMKSKYTILSGNKTYDVLELANECIFLWSDFIEKLQKKYKS